MTANFVENAENEVPLQSSDSSASAVQVAVRVRPMLPHEAGNTSCIEVLKGSTSSPISTVIRLGGESGPTFTFDQVFPLTTMQQDVYAHRVAPLVASCLEGYNATILAYGQTGSGKTHTIMGPSASIAAAVQDERHAGVIPRAIRSIFEQLEGWGSDKDSSDDKDDDSLQKQTRSRDDKPSYDYDVRVQFLEVYGQEIRDLLANTQETNKKLSIRDVGMAEPEVVGASEIKVESAEEALLCLTRGMYRRVTGATAMNESSSRSHAIFSLIVEQSTVVNQIDGTPKKARGAIDNDDPLQQHVQAKRSKFNFVDLAGSERQKRTQASGQRLKEGININQGLLVLGNVISALGDPKKQGKTHVPYRDSNLTRLLKGSLGGNHKTLMIACVSPAANNLEETLNCLRYANRAKNIQNHAVVNVDATTRLVAELRGKIQLLASDLLKARDGNLDSLSIPFEVVQNLAKGGDGESIIPQLPVAPSPFPMRTDSNETKENEPSRVLNFQADLDLHLVKAENEIYRMKLEALSNGQQDPLAELQKSFTSRAAEYEREIALLRSQVDAASGMHDDTFFDDGAVGMDDDRSPNRPPRTPGRRSTARAESPELSRLRAQIFGSMAQAKNLDAEVEAEEKAVAALTNKYLGRQPDDDENDDDGALQAEVQATELENEAVTVRLEAEMFELSTSINAKEVLIQKLQVSQKKFETMREFYEDRLREMATLLAEKEHETEKLSEELAKLDKDHSDAKELEDRLKLKQEQVAELRRKQAELTRLTTVASKNESQIAKLSQEITDMKHKKVELQKQITTERKNHAAELQKLKKESIQQQRELIKVKQLKDQKAMEAQKAQLVAKARLDQVFQLKNKYKESEKRLRILTVKRGVMSRAGLDPVMVGRRQAENPSKTKKGQSPPDQQNEDSINIDGIRDFFDQKVAEVGRREALAEKLAQEWEEHLDLSSQREELLQSAQADDKESIESLDSRIKYKEERIRQLAARLGKPQKDLGEESKEDETFLFTKEFKRYIGNASPMASTRMAAKILFGMVVRERRRIAALARTASSLDEKVQEAEAAVAAKDAAFRAYVDEQRLEAAELAQNQQQHILSLMDMVREVPDNGEMSSPVRSAKARHAEKANSKLLLLANERIAVLERQLNETQLSRDSIQKHREREDAAREMLAEKTRECEDLEEELNELRFALRRIKDEVTIQDDLSIGEGSGDKGQEVYHSILEIVKQSLQSSTKSQGSPSKRKKDSSDSPGIRSQGVTIRRRTEFVHTSDTDEVPDWADDIMKDLDVIAKGEIPVSLKEAPDVVNAETQLQPESVFERLTNPESFTGVQKQRKWKVASSKKSRAESTTDGQRQRRLISKQVAHSLDRVVVPGNQAEPEGNRRTSRDSDNEDAKSRSVFDRLLSPSNLTGTQKQRFQEKKGRREGEKHIEEQQHGGDDKGKVSLRTAHVPSRDVDHQLYDIHDEGSEISDSKGKDPAASAKAQSSRRREEYKELDVFERLNKTTTQAYAVKQHVNIAEKMLDDLLDESEPKDDHDHHKADDYYQHRIEAYTQQNVFERLQKTTTMAYAVKHNNHGVLDKHVDDQQDKRENRSSSPRSIQSPASKSQAIREDELNDRMSGSTAEKMLDELLFENSDNEEDDSAPDVFSPIRSRLRPRK